MMEIPLIDAPDDEILNIDREPSRFDDIDVPHDEEPVRPYSVVVPSKPPAASRRDRILKRRFTKPISPSSSTNGRSSSTGRLPVQRVREGHNKRRDELVSRLSKKRSESVPKLRPRLASDTSLDTKKEEKISMSIIETEEKAKLSKYERLTKLQSTTRTSSRSASPVTIHQDAWNTQALEYFASMSNIRQSEDDIFDAASWAASDATFSTVSAGLDLHNEPLSPLHKDISPKKNQNFQDISSTCNLNETLTSPKSQSPGKDQDQTYVPSPNGDESHKETNNIIPEAYCQFPPPPPPLPKGAFMETKLDTSDPEEEDDQESDVDLNTLHSDEHQQKASKPTSGLPPRSEVLLPPPPPPPPPPPRRKKKTNSRTRRRSKSPGFPSVPEEEEDDDDEINDGNEDSQSKSPKNLCAFSTDETVTPEKSTEPASASQVIRDTKLAEKVALEISHAALMFEEQHISTPIRTSSSEERGAFSHWNDGSSANSSPLRRTNVKDVSIVPPADLDKDELLMWFTHHILRQYDYLIAHEEENDINRIRELLSDRTNFNRYCSFLSTRVSLVDMTKQLDVFVLPDREDPSYARVYATNFVRFIRDVASSCGIESPFGKDNPFLSDIVGSSIKLSRGEDLESRRSELHSMQDILFSYPASSPVVLLSFAHKVYQATLTASDVVGSESNGGIDRPEMVEKNYIVPSYHPSPFEAAVFLEPKIIPLILDFLGDPVAVCRTKMLNQCCFKYVSAHEHVLMRDAVRRGGMSMNVRPYFWLWVSLQKCDNENKERAKGSRRISSSKDLTHLEHIGRESKWHHVIERDVTRSFGNLPPHKTGARLRTDSIVRALVSWGQSRLLKHGVKGKGDVPPVCSSNSTDEDDTSVTPTDTVSDWGGVTPVGSFSSGYGEDEKKLDEAQARRKRRGRRSPEELALSGNALTNETKEQLQGKLSLILHALAAAHQDVGYCQGMDYVVAHLLRILQDTIRWQAATGTITSIVKSSPVTLYGPDIDGQALSAMYAEVDRSLVVEETIFRVMDAFLSTYDLRHFYWPELRCLKTCCLVFERVIHIKLPVLADHFEHHELNVGLFALGWFQTLFLYLPSMPSATVCHMWDIWLVERSFKIFFRVGVAILFLSQPILLNHELEGMMSYLNTFPDATLLSPDILIACALQIKLTNQMLMELEQQVTETMLSD